MPLHLRSQVTSSSDRRAIDATARVHDSNDASRRSTRRERAQQVVPTARDDESTTPTPPPTWRTRRDHRTVGNRDHHTSLSAAPARSSGLLETLTHGEHRSTCAASHKRADVFWCQAAGPSGLWADLIRCDCDVLCRVSSGCRRGRDTLCSCCCVLDCRGDSCPPCWSCGGLLRCVLPQLE